MAPSIRNQATVPITVTAVNDAPTVTNPGNQSSVEGALVSVQVVAADVDGDVLSYAASGLPNGVSIDTSSGLISGTISFTAAGSHTVTVTVSDATSTATTGFTWAVTNTNQAPVFAQDLADRSDAEGAVITLTAAATDPDGDGLSYAASGLPAGVSIDTSTGLISGTISFTAAGSHAVTVSSPMPPPPRSSAIHLDDHQHQPGPGRYRPERDW